MVRENVVSHLVVPSTVTSLNHVLKCVCVCVCARMCVCMGGYAPTYAHGDWIKGISAVLYLCLLVPLRKDLFLEPGPGCYELG